MRQDESPARAATGGDDPDAFLDRATRLLDWAALAPWIGAVEDRLAMPVSVALFKMMLLERWFQLSGAQLDDSCHARSAFRRFLGAPLHGPVAEVWMYRQFKPRLAIAEQDVGRLIAAAEMVLNEHGLANPGYAWRVSAAPVLAPDDALPTRLFEPGGVGETPAAAHAAASPTRSGTALLPPLAPSMPATAAMLVWPWGQASSLERTLRVGRDPDFSPFARQLWADPRISRRHAEIEPREAGVLVRDLGSANGTWIGERALPSSGSALVTQDAQLRFGVSLLVKLVFLPPRSEAPASAL